MENVVPFEGVFRRYSLQVQHSNMNIRYIHRLLWLPALGAHCAPVAGGSWRLTDHVELARPTRTHILDCTCRLKPHRVAIDHRQAAARLLRADDHAAGGGVEAAGLLAWKQAA